MAKITADIRGYRQLTEGEQRLVNDIKNLEADEVVAMYKAVKGLEDSDKRMVAIAKTHFQEGFSALIRAVTRPDDVYED
jgi:hypothetical protein